nr:F-box protein At1g61340-like [Ipomoea trifida]
MKVKAWCVWIDLIQLLQYIIPPKLIRQSKEDLVTVQDDNKLPSPLVRRRWLGAWLEATASSGETPATLATAPPTSISNGQNGDRHATSPIFDEQHNNYGGALPLVDGSSITPSTLIGISSNTSQLKIGGLQLSPHFPVSYPPATHPCPGGVESLPQDVRTMISMKWQFEYSTPRKTMDIQNLVGFEDSIYGLQ